MVSSGDGALMKNSGKASTAKSIDRRADWAEQLEDFGPDAVLHNGRYVAAIREWFDGAAELAENPQNGPVTGPRPAQTSREALDRMRE